MVDSQRNKKLILHIDLQSQPARSITSFCMLNNIPHEVKTVSMFKGEHMGKAYAQINPAKQIPAIQEVDTTTGETFTLTEHGAIMRYIA